MKNDTTSPQDASSNASRQHQSKTVPRYTSYPTAAEFSNAIDSQRAMSWLDAIEDNQSLSLYIHIPFCDQLCWFCGCHTKVINKYSPVTHYLNYLIKEIELTAQRIGQAPVKHLHFGGGSPSILQAEDFSHLMRVLRENFNMRETEEIAIEIDPRTVSLNKIKAYAHSGMTRASIGVQDFDRQVQNAINRVQSFEMVQETIAAFRAEGVRNINIDFVYGLPLQTIEKLSATMELAQKLEPNRVSIFGYAHVPKLKKHQNLIPLDILPNDNERRALNQAARDYWCDAGYQEIGLDHFAKPNDVLAIAARQGRLKRNFQGYTTDRADALIGLGISSISTLPHGYAQNTIDMSAYAKALDKGEWPVIRGVATDAQDIKYREIIMNLMCFMRSELPEAEFAKAKRALQPYLAAGDIQYENGILEIKPQARERIRLIASAFDQYLLEDETRFSVAT